MHSGHPVHSVLGPEHPLGGFGPCTRCPGHPFGAAAHILDAPNVCFGLLGAFGVHGTSCTGCPECTEMCIFGAFGARKKMPF